MAITFHNQNCSYRILNKQKIKKWFSEIIHEEGKTFSDIAIVLTSNEDLLKINIEFLHHEYFTDIITFTYTASPISGDIYISYPQVKENAKNFNVKVSHELLRIFAHGALHLCGYNDKTKSERAQMSNLEDYYMKKFYERF